MRGISSDCCDSISRGMQKGVVKKYEELRKSSSSAEKRKSRSEEPNSSSKRTAKQKSAKKTKQVSGNSSFSRKGASKNNLTCENAVARK